LNISDIFSATISFIEKKIELKDKKQDKDKQLQRCRLQKRQQEHSQAKTCQLAYIKQKKLVGLQIGGYLHHHFGSILRNFLLRLPAI
jgi:hypothetical protein